MRKYLNRMMRLIKRFEEADFVQIPREKNVEADTLANEALTNGAMDELMRFSIYHVWISQRYNK